MSVVVVATLVPAPEHRAEVLAVLESAIAEAHREPGCELYALHEGADRLVFVEKWASKEALAVHSQGPVLAALGPVLATKLAAPMDLQVVEPRPAGDQAKGAL